MKDLQEVYFLNLLLNQEKLRVLRGYFHLMVLVLDKNHYNLDHLLIHRYHLVELNQVLLEQQNLLLHQLR